MGDPLQLDAIAGDRLEEALKKYLANEDVITISASAWVQSQLSQAALWGVIRMLVHKNVFSDAELARSLALAYDERRLRIENAVQEKGSIVVAGAMPAVTVRGRN